MLDIITFSINGVEQRVSVAEYAGHSLAKYIRCSPWLWCPPDRPPPREVACLTGTKVSCNEGGCGACMVTVDKGEGTTRSVNAVGRPSS